MMSLSEFEASQAEASQGEASQVEASQVEASQAAPEAGLGPGLPLTRVDDARLAELKAQARAMIEDRLRAKRKQRRLMRGGESW